VPGPGVIDSASNQQYVNIDAGGSPMRAPGSNMRSGEWGQGVHWFGQTRDDEHARLQPEVVLVPELRGPEEALVEHCTCISEETVLDGWPQAKSPGARVRGSVLRAWSVSSSYRLPR
jgi:hypothetical protein